MLADGHYALGCMHLSKGEMTGCVLRAGELTVAAAGGI